MPNLVDTAMKSTGTPKPSIAQALAHRHSYITTRLVYSGRGFSSVLTNVGEGDNRPWIGIWFSFPGASYDGDGGHKA